MTYDKDKDLAELGEMLKGAGEKPVEAAPEPPQPGPTNGEIAPEPVEAKQPEPTEVPAEEPEKQAAESKPEAEPVDDPLQVAEQHLAIERAKFEAEMALQRAHAARLAGKIGHLEKLMRDRAGAREEPEEPEEPEPEPDERPRRGRDGLLERLERLERERREQEIGYAVAAEAEQFKQLVLKSGYKKEELEPVAKVNAEFWAEALDAPDPATAAAMAKATFARMAAELEGKRFEARRAQARQRQAATVPQKTLEKLQQTPSAGGATAAPKKEPKTYKDMTADELKAELRRQLTR